MTASKHSGRKVSLSLHFRREDLLMRAMDAFEEMGPSAITFHVEAKCALSIDELTKIPAVEASQPVCISTAALQQPRRTK